MLLFSSSSCSVWDCTFHNLMGLLSCWAKLPLVQLPFCISNESAYNEYGWGGDIYLASSIPPQLERGDIHVGNE